MTEKKRMGRPPTGNVRRDAELTFSLTEEDAQWFRDLADVLGFTSRGAMLTAIMERLRAGGMAPACFFRVGWQIAKRAEEVGSSKGAGLYNIFKPLPPFELREKPRPEPAIPAGGPEPKEINKVLRELKLQLQSNP